MKGTPTMEQGMTKLGFPCVDKSSGSVGLPSVGELHGSVDSFKMSCLLSCIKPNNARHKMKRNGYECCHYNCVYILL